MNNKKRLIGIIVGLTMSAASIVGLSACGGGHEHTWEDAWTTSATEHWHNPECDDTTELKDKGTHVWDDGVVLTEPGHSTQGQKKYTCETCQYEKIESIPATGHTYADELEYDDDSHWKVPTCECEGMTEAELKKDKAEHTLVPVVDTPATDTANGKQHFECSTEGCDYKTEQVTLYNYIGEKISGGDKVTVGNVEDDTTVIHEQNIADNKWTGAVKLTKLGMTGKQFIYDLHVGGKYAGTWGDAWAWQRFGIQVTENTGFYIWVRDNAITIRKFVAENKTAANHECTEEGVVVSGADETTYGWISNAILSDSGADIRIVRVNTKLVLSVEKDGKYIEIGSVTCGEETNEFALYGVTAEFTFSDFAVSALTHVEAKAPSETETGNFEYYYTGADTNKVYYDTNGKLTTWDKIERPAVIASVEVTLKTKKDGATINFSGTTLKVNGEDVDVANGVLTLTDIEPNVEITLATDEYAGKLTPVEGTTAYTVILEYNYATATGKVDLSHMNDSNHAITVSEQDKNGDAWTGSAVLNEIEATSKTFVYDLHVSGKYAGSWGDAWAWKRMGIQVTENTGFYLWVRDNAVTIRKFTAANKTNAGAECQEEVLVGGSAEGTYGWISNAVLNADGTGADFRIVRINDKLNLYVKNNDGYQYIGTVTCGEEANEFAIYGVTAEFTFSGFGVEALTHVDEKAPTATEDGNYEYYYTGAEDNKVYYDKDGKLTTWADIFRQKFEVWESATLTLQGVEEGTEVVLSSDIRTVKATVGTNGVITLSGATEITKNIYTVTVGNVSIDIDFRTENSVVKVISEKTVDDFTAQNTVKVVDIGRVVKSTAYTVTFDLKANTQNTDTWRYRFAVLLTDGNGVTGIGSIVIHDGKLIIWSAQGVSPNDGDGVNVQNKTEVNFLKFGELVKGNGATVKIVRNGLKATMYFDLDGEWVELYSTTLSDGNTVLKFACNNDVEWSLSNITLDYATEVITSIESMEVTFETKKDGATTDFSGTTIKVNDKEVNVTNGKITLSEVEPDMPITFETEDYIGTVTPVLGTSSYTVTLEYKWATGSGTADLSKMNEAAPEIVIGGADVTDDWSGIVNLNELTKQQTSNTFVYDIHVKAENNSDGAYKRLGLKVTENTGFYFWIRDNAISIRKFTANNLTNGKAECADETVVVWPDEGTYGWISNAILSDSGADIRIVRVNTKLVLSVKKDGQYIEIGSVTCGEETNNLGLYGLSTSYTFSNMSVSALTYVNTDNEKIEHYTLDDTIYSVKGYVVTEADLVLCASASLTLTGVDGNVIAENTAVTLTNNINTVTAKVGENGVVTLDGKVIKAVYKVSVGNIDFEVDFTTDNTALTKVVGADFTAKNTVKTIDMGAAKESDNYTVEFNLKATPGTDTWRYRFALLLINGDDNTVTGIGSIVIHDDNLIIWSAKGESPNDPADCTKKNDANSLKFGELIKGADGANIKVVRNGSNVTMSFELEDEFVELWTATLGEGQTNLKFSCNNDVEWTVSNLTIAVASETTPDEVTE